LEKAVRAQKTVSLYSPESKSAKAFELLAKNLLQDESESFVIRKGIAGILTGIFTR
jgi:MinD-like ATPase involved in chromosome partitioning or flagellar assembly